MRRITCWQSDDGVIHRRRIDAVARDRQLRKAKIQAKAATSYLFMVTAAQDNKILKPSRRPAYTDLDDGLYMYFWKSQPGVGFEQAIKRIRERCDRFERRWPLGWSVDYEVKVMVGGKETDSIYLGESTASAEA